MSAVHNFSLTAVQMLHPHSVHRPADVNKAPQEKGIYGRLFASGSLPVPDAPYARTDGFELMYVAIAPKDRAQMGRKAPVVFAPA